MAIILVPPDNDRALQRNINKCGRVECSRNWACICCAAVFALAVANFESMSADQPQKMVAGPKITHVIFDLDGLLLDTEPIYTKVNSEVLKRYNKEYTMEMKAQSCGMKAKEAIALHIRMAGLEGKLSVDEYYLHYLDLLAIYLPDAKLLPGAAKLIRHFAAHSIPMALCTSSSTSEYEAKTKNHKALLELIPLRVLIGDDPGVKHSKPAPDGFLVAMHRFLRKPASAANVVVFEDSMNGVQAAIAAGMRVVMVPDPLYSRVPEGCRDKIDLIVKSLKDFKPETMGFPPY